ncbi:MAG TPA: hypothetical protein VGR79_10375 [Stellaceae bacterium]|nr:hypothetical protein [Stellaceae bacterium]
MQRHTRTLLTALLGASALTMLGTTSSSALDLPTPLKYDMGPLGEWRVNGGIEAALSGWNNKTPTTGGNSSGAAGAAGTDGGVTGDIDLTNAIFIINSHGNMFGGDDGIPLQFHAWLGEPPQTPVIGYTSPNVAPNLYSSVGKHSLNDTGAASFLFKGWATYQPLDFFSIEGGRLPSVDGTEIGVGFLNLLPFLSDLNNMQTTVADGFQINLMTPGDNSYYFGFLPGYGSTLTIRVADGYKTGHMNELGFVGLWNLTPDGSDFIVGYGHTRLDTVGNDNTVANGAGFGNTNPFAVGGFGMWNSNLIGFGTVYNLTRRLVLNAEVENQWLPQSAIPTADRGNFGGRSQDYYRWSTQWTLGYDFGIQQILGEPIRFGWAAQPSFTYQHGNTSDPHGNVFGNFLGLDVGPASSVNTSGNNAAFGTFGQGSKMFAFQTGPSFQFHNAFLRPTIAYTRLASVDPGFGYGKNGTDHDQVVLMLDFGFLLGQQEDTDTGQH